MKDFYLLVVRSKGKFRMPWGKDLKYDIHWINRTFRVSLSIFLCFSFCGWAVPGAGMVVGANIPWGQLLGYWQTWGFILPKLITDPVW
jgi:hypothetical protein